MPDNQPNIAAAIEWAKRNAVPWNPLEAEARAILALNEQLEQARADIAALPCVEQAGSAMVMAHIHGVVYDDSGCGKCRSCVERSRQRQGGE